MKKIFLGLIVTLLSVTSSVQSANAANYKLKLTVIQTDSVIKVYDDEDQSQKGASKKCMTAAFFYNPEPLDAGDLFADELVGAGTKIKVMGSSGQTVGIGKIKGATFVKTTTYQDPDPTIGKVVQGYCKYSASISVGSSKFYAIKVGNVEPIDVSLADLKKYKWNYIIKVWNY